MAEEGAGVQIDARTAQPLGKLLLRPGGNPHRERPGPGAAQPPQSAVMPATAPAGAQSWVAGTRMQLTQAGPRSGSSPGHGLLPPSRTQVTRRHACRGPLEVRQGEQLSAAGPDGCHEAAAVEELAGHPIGTASCREKVV